MHLYFVVFFYLLLKIVVVVGGNFDPETIRNTKPRKLAWGRYPLCSDGLPLRCRRVSAMFSIILQYNTINILLSMCHNRYMNGKV